MGKGILETFSDRFKAGEPRPDGRQPMLNPNRLSENQNSNYPRSKEDHVRRILGLSSLGESRAKETLYLNNQENRRMKTARDTAIDKLWDGVMTKNQAKVDENAQAFIDLDGSDTELKAAIERKLQDTYLTQQEKEAMKANTISKVMNLKRRLEMSR
jgi:hypothetical protein